MIAVTSQPVLAAPSPNKPGHNSPSSAPVAENAVRLSKLLNPSDRALQLGMAAFEAGINAQLQKSPDDAATYQKNPGLLDAILAAGRPVIRKHLESRIPEHQQRYARFYADKFSPAEIDELIAFYSTPTGAKVIAAMYAGHGIDKVVEAMDKNDGNLSANDVQEINGAEAAKLPDVFDADDWKAISAFGATPAHAKLQSIAPEFRQLVADIENEDDPAMDADLDKAVTDAVTKYVENKKQAAGH